MISPKEDIMEKSSRTLPVFFAIVIALAVFTVILAATARFMPAILRFAGSRWVHVLPLITTLLITLAVWMGARRKTRT